MVYTHQKLAWLRPENIKDKEGRKKDHPEYDSRTLYVPPDFLNKQTPGLKQCTMCRLGSMIPLYKLFPCTIYRGNDPNSALGVNFH